MLFKIKYFDKKNEIVDTVYFNTCCLACSVIESSDFLDEMIGEDEWNFLSVKALLNFQDMVNQEEDDHFTGDCSCPFETYETSTPENRIDMMCPQCKGEIKVADNSWLTIRCPSCDLRIERSELSKDKEGKWIYTKSIEKND